MSYHFGFINLFQKWFVAALKLGLMVASFTAISKLDNLDD